MATGIGLAHASAGRYRLLGEIARGGMGAVLRGRDPDLGRDLALKVLLDQHRDRPDLVDRFVEEAQICGQLQHPGVVPVYELGTLADRRPFFAMKLVKGRTLADLLAGRGAEPDLPRFLSIFEAICQTMAYAHARGVIHRDLKPVQRDGRGLRRGAGDGLGPGQGPAQGRPAKTAEVEPPANETVVATLRSSGDSDLSQAGSVLGTPAYMAPEQARGETEIGRPPGRRLRAGLDPLRDPHRGAGVRRRLGRSRSSRAAGRADTAAALARLARCGADVELLALARDCLAAEAKDRPADAGVVAGRMTAYLAGVQERLREAELSRAAESARAEEAEAKAAAERRARRLTGALAATVLLAGGLGGAGWRWVELQRLERVREATARVNVALQEATRLRGLAQGAAVGDLAPWDAAASAAEKARDLLDAGRRAGRAQAGRGPGRRARRRARPGRGRGRGGRSRSPAARPAGRHPLGQGRRPGRRRHRRRLRRRVPRGGARPRRADPRGGRPIGSRPGRRRWRRPWRWRWTTGPRSGAIGGTTRPARAAGRGRPPGRPRPLAEQPARRPGHRRSHPLVAPA